MYVIIHITFINIEAVESVSWGTFRVNFTTLEEILNHLRIYNLVWLTANDLVQDFWNTLEHDSPLHCKINCRYKYKSDTQLYTQFTATTGNLIFN